MKKYFWIWYPMLAAIWIYTVIWQWTGSIVTQPNYAISQAINQKIADVVCSTGWSQAKFDDSYSSVACTYWYPPVPVVRPQYFTLGLITSTSMTVATYTFNYPQPETVFSNGNGTSSTDYLVIGCAGQVTLYGKVVGQLKEPDAKALCRGGL